MEKVWFRRLEKKDYDNVYDLIEKASGHPFFSFDTTYFDKDTYFHLINQMEIRKLYIQYGIFYKDQLIGIVSLHDIDSDKSSGEYSIYLKQDYHHKGFAHKATTFILTEAFQRIGLHHVYLRVDSNNEMAIRFYERFGFVPSDLCEHKSTQGYKCYEISEDRLI